MKADNLGKAILKELQSYQKEVQEDMDKVADEVADEVVEKLKNESPKSNRKSGGAYAGSWVKSKDKGKIKIHNKEHYRLTHLLERGYAKRNGGRTKAMPHIEPVEQFAIETFPKKLEERLGR